jgi:hypothetical protein
MTPEEEKTLEVATELPPANAGVAGVGAKVGLRLVNPETGEEKRVD